LRRQEKEIADRAVIDSILHRATICRLGLADGSDPYVVPLCFGYDGRSLFFHSALSGRKIDMIKRNSRVCFEVDVDQEIVGGAKACGWTMKYKSAIGFGRAILIHDPAEKEKGLQILMRHYSDGAFTMPKAALDKTLVIKVEIESVTGKESG